jgi:hypothetical protein
MGSPNRGDCPQIAPQTRQPGGSLKPCVDAAVGCPGPDKEQEHHLTPVRVSDGKQETAARRSRERGRIEQLNGELDAQFRRALELDISRHERLVL